MYDFKVTGELLAQGANRELVDSSGRDASYYAGQHGFVTMMQFAAQKMIR